MELEITIKVPLGAAGAVVEQRTTSDEPAPPPEPVDVAAPVATPSSVPPGLEDMELDQLLGASNGATPPDLPDPATIPSLDDEFAPPPIETVEALAEGRTPDGGAAGATHDGPLDGDGETT